MAKGVQDAVKSGVTKAARGTSKSLAPNHSDGALSGVRGVAAGAGAAVLAPLAVKGVGKLVRSGTVDGVGDAVKAPGKAAANAASDLGSKVSSGLGEKLSAGVGNKVSEKIDSAGGPSGILKDSVKGALGFGGDKNGDKKRGGNAPGTGKGRRMPVQQSVDIGAPLERVYNQWTQFEQWPEFMHRVTRVTQEDESTVSFAVKIWGKTKEFKAEIETQRPNERIKWRVSEGMTHTGVVTFHELGPQLTRVLLGLDVEPGGLLEKAARGLRHIKRAARGDLHRFKAFIEMQDDEEAEGWRGVIEEGEVAQKSGGTSRRSGSQRSGERRGASSSGRASSRSSSRARGSGGNGARGTGSQASRSGGSSRSRGRSTAGSGGR